MLFDPTETHRYRMSTDIVTKQSGIGNYGRKCKVCGINCTNAKKRKGTGTSRFNETVWLCPECHKKEN